MRPIMSIIIPIYNVEQYITKCFDSIRKQKAKEEIEIICIDDGSTDGSSMICDRYAKIDKRFKVIHQKNSGVAVARNVGLDVAQGKYIAWIDPDDYIADNWYEKINIFMEKNIDFIFFDYAYLINDTIKKVRYRNNSGYIKKENFLKELVLDKKIQSQLWSKVMKQTLFYNIRIPEKFKVLEDFAIMPYLVEKANTIYYISDCLYYYLIREGSLLNNKINIDNDYMSYLISKNRYKYLIGKNIAVSKIDYLSRAAWLCSSFYKLKTFSQEEKYKFDICKKELKNNVKYILMSKDATIFFKLKAIACKLEVLGILLKIKKKI